MKSPGRSKSKVTAQGVIADGIAKMAIKAKRGRQRTDVVRASKVPDKCRHGRAVGMCRRCAK